MIKGVVAPSWDGNQLVNVCELWDREMVSKPECYDFENTNRTHRYKVRVTHWCLRDIKAAHGEAQRVRGVLLLKASITTPETGHAKHAVAVDEPCHNQLLLRGLNSWGSQNYIVDVTQENFNDAVTVEPEIFAAKGPKGDVPIPVLTILYTAMSSRQTAAAEAAAEAAREAARKADVARQAEAERARKEADANKKKEADAKEGRRRPHRRRAPRRRHLRRHGPVPDCGRALPQARRELRRVRGRFRAALCRGEGQV